MKFTHPSRLIAGVITTGMLLVAGAGLAAPASAATPATLANASITLSATGSLRVAAVTPSASTEASLLASWNPKLPALRAALARGLALPAALAAARLPALTLTPSTDGVVSAFGAHPDGASCQYSSCGWKLSANSTYELEWLVWAGSISGPGAICLLFGPETAGIACTVAAAIWGIVASYVDAPPSYSGKCMYIGETIQLHPVVKLEKC